MKVELQWKDKSDNIQTEDVSRLYKIDEILPEVGEIFSLGPDDFSCRCIVSVEKKRNKIIINLGPKDKTIAKNWLEALCQLIDS